MSMIHRFSLTLLVAFLLAVSASTASAGPVIVGALSGDDSPSFGLTVTVFNDSDAELLDGGDSFHSLVLDLLAGDDGDQPLAQYTLDVLDVGQSWMAPGLADQTTTFGSVTRVSLSLMFRGVSLSSMLETCAVDGEGCFTDVFVPLGSEIDCLVESPTCELIGRTAEALIEYDAPVSSVPDGSVPMGEVLASLFAMATALRYLRPGRREGADSAPLA